MSTETPDGWNIKKLSGSLGAEITGVSLADAKDTEVDQVKSLLTEHMVLFFPGQFLNNEDHVTLGRYFGELEGHPNFKTSESGLPEEIFQLTATSGGVADEWHTDITFQKHPALMSILNMVTCPATGGDTMWTSLNAAYDELSDPMKELCEGLTALHDALPHNHPEQMTVHPVIRVHPETGKKALYVNEHFTRRIVEMSAGESEALLGYLTNWVTNPRFTIRYSWTAGTIAMWDNRCTQHFVLNDFEGERVIQRVTIMGDTVTGAAEPKWQPWIRPGRLSATSRHDRQLFGYLKNKQLI